MEKVILLTFLTETLLIKAIILNINSPNFILDLNIFIVGLYILSKEILCFSWVRN